MVENKSSTHIFSKSIQELIVSQLKAIKHKHDVVNNQSKGCWFKTAKYIRVKLKDHFRLTYQTMKKESIRKKRANKQYSITS